METNLKVLTPLPAAIGLNEIQQMMYSFGDYRRPNPETAAIAETFVLSQMKAILHASAEVASYRESKVLLMEDILFLMRKNPIKIQRLIKHLKTKEIRHEMKLVEKGEVGVDKGRTCLQRCEDYLRTIDESGKLLAACTEEYFDTVHMERLIRLDRMTRSMEDKRYAEFCRARQISFRGKYSAQFQASLQETVDSLEVRVEKLTNDILCYLAYETLGQLVEMCLMVRRDTRGTPNDDVSRLQPVQAINPLYPNVSLPIREKLDPLKKSVTSNHAITPAEIREAIRRLQHQLRGVSQFSRKRKFGSNVGLPPSMDIIAI